MLAQALELTAAVPVTKRMGQRVLREVGELKGLEVNWEQERE